MKDFLLVILLQSAQMLLQDLLPCATWPMTVLFHPFVHLSVGPKGWSQRAKARDDTELN